MSSAADRNPSRLTLKGLLVGMTTGLLLLLLLGSLWLNLHNLRQYMNTQLRSHAQDAATSLGLSLSSQMDGQDLVLAESMIDVIYDSGYYREIVLRDLEGRPLVERRSDLWIEDVPEWFVRWIALDTPSGGAEVSRGWQRLGTLTVVSHPGFAYRDLWQLLRFQLGWFLAIALVGYLAARLLVGMILGPLARIERQAGAIGQRDFSARAPLPRTRELRQVARTMNDMAERLERIHREQVTLIEDLRMRSHRDPLTGLSNRAEFDQRLSAELESQQGSALGSLALLQVGHFEEINRSRGRAAGDELLRALGRELTLVCDAIPGALVARRSGTDFGLYLPGLVEDSAERFAADLLTRLAALPEIRQLERNDLLHLGLATSLRHRAPAALLAAADLALRQAQSRGVNGWQLAQDEDAQGTAYPRQAGEWLEILRRVLAERSLRLYFQPVLGRDRRTLLFHQVLSRIQVDGRLVEAGDFLPMAEHYRLLGDFDRLSLSDLLQRLEERPQDQDSYALSLSLQSLVTDAFPAELAERLGGRPDLARRLVLALPEYGLKVAQARVEQFIRRVQALGCRIAIDRFGTATVPFGYLQRLPVHFIKLDHGLVRGIHASSDNQFFLQAVRQIARGQGIQVIAVGVEQSDEWRMVERLDLDGAMGFYLARPQEAPFRPE